MNIIETGHSMNFVDKNDVYVGFEMGRSCCESFGWRIFTPQGFLIAHDEQEKVDFDGAKKTLLDYVFDAEFFEAGGDCENGEDGAWAMFRLLYKPDEPEPFRYPNYGDELRLVLHNAHNGYYGHGFEVKHGGETVREGSL